MKYIFLLASCLLSTAGYSQNTHPNIPFEHVPIPGTINSSQVNALVQDHHGLIWAAGDGLFKYDGYKFTSYKHLATGESIAGQEIKYLFEDNVSSRLLIATHSYGIVAYDYETDKINALTSKGGTPIISHIAQTEDGTIWGSSFSNGLYYLENDTLKKLADPGNRFGHITSLLAVKNKLLADKSKTIYIIREKKLIDSIAVAYPEFDFHFLTRVTTMTSDPMGRIWMGTERAGVLVYDTVKRLFVKHFAPDKDPFYNRINRIMVDKNNTIWILTKASGVVVYGMQSENYIHITKNPLVERSLS